MLATPRRTAPRGFTLVELLVVVAIIGLISAVALPVVLPALNERKVSEAARLLQAVLAGTRDAAIRANAPRGIRLLIDPGFPFEPGKPLASNRFTAIEPAPDYSEGVVRGISLNYPPPNAGTLDPQYVATDLRIAEVGTTAVGTATVLNAPTGWRFNMRQGDRIRFNNSGAYYTIAGPIYQDPTETISGSKVINNPERYICYTTSPVANATLANWVPEYLSLTNGVDDDGDGWIDESCDGIDNDGDTVIDPGFNGIDDNHDGTIDEPLELFYNKIVGGTSLTNNEFEQEVFIGAETSSNLQNANYTISRRPVISPNAAETTLPAGAVIDLTTWNAAAATPAPTTDIPYPPPLLPERSRLPVDAFSGTVDVLIDQTGRVVPPGAGSGGGGYYANSPISSLPFYHFWITEREGVATPLWDVQPVLTPYVPTRNPNYGVTATSQNYFLPMPQGTFDSLGNPYTGPFLKGERRLVTLFTKTGQIVSNSIESFNLSDTNTPYYDAQAGIKESQ